MTLAPASPSALDRPWAIAVLLAVLAAAVPVACATIPPLLDYPNHLARQYILDRAATSALLGQWYATSWHASPYLAFDAIVQALARVMPIEMAGRVFVGLMLLLLGLAPLMLNWAVAGRVTPPALLGLLFVHNHTVTLGFLNYLFGIGLGLCAAALWIRWRGAGLWTRLLGFPLLCTAVFFSHLLGFVLYVLVVGSHEFGRWVGALRREGGTLHWRLDRDQQWNLLSIALQCALPLAIFALLGPSTQSVSQNTYGGLERKFLHLLGVFDYLVPPYLWWPDRLLQVLIPVALVLLLLTRQLRIARELHWPLMALMALYFAMPMELFKGWGADHRLLPAFGMLFVGSLRPGDGRAPRWRHWAVGALALLVVVRVAAVSMEWRKFDAIYSNYERAFDVISDGNRVYFAFGHSGTQQVSIHPVYHLPTLVLSRRDVYVPYLFATDSGSFTLRYQPEIKSLQHLSPGPVLTDRRSPNWPAIVERFDYFLLVDEQHFAQPVPQELVRVYHAGRVSVYKRP